MELCQYVDLCFHASSLPCLHTFWHAIPTSFYIFNVFIFLLLLRMAKWAASCSCHMGARRASECSIKMQWVAPHSLARPDSRVQRRVWPTAYLAAVNIEALQMDFLYFKALQSTLQMHFTFHNNNNNNLPACISALLLEKPLNRN